MPERPPGKHFTAGMEYGVTDYGFPGFDRPTAADTMTLFMRAPRTGKGGGR
jgi:hypothetical protein